MAITKAHITNLENNDEFEVMFNPTDYSLSKTNNWTKVPIRESDVPRSDFSGGDPAALPAVRSSLPPHLDAGLTPDDILPPPPTTSLPEHGQPATSNPLLPDVNPFRVRP